MQSIIEMLLCVDASLSERFLDCKVVYSVSMLGLQLSDHQFSPVEQIPHCQSGYIVLTHVPLSALVPTAISRCDLRFQPVLKLLNDCQNITAVAAMSSSHNQLLSYRLLATFLEVLFDIGFVQYYVRTDSRNFTQFLSRCCLAINKCFCIQVLTAVYSFKKQEFFIADATEDQVFVCACINSTSTNLYISGSRGTEYSLSLENIMYYSPSSSYNWLS